MEVRQRSTEIMQLTIEQELQETDDISPYYWTPTTIIAFFMVIYCFVHSVMLTDGFFSTCKQYRNRVIKHTLAKGEMVSELFSNNVYESHPVIPTIYADLCVSFVGRCSAVAIDLQCNLRLHGLPSRRFVLRATSGLPNQHFDPVHSVNNRLLGCGRMLDHNFSD